MQRHNGVQPLNQTHIYEVSIFKPAAGMMVLNAQGKRQQQVKRPLRKGHEQADRMKAELALSDAQRAQVYESLPQARTRCRGHQGQGMPTCRAKGQQARRNELKAVERPLIPN